MSEAFKQVEQDPHQCKVCGDQGTGYVEFFKDGLSLGKFCIVCWVDKFKELGFPEVEPVE